MVGIRDSIVRAVQYLTDNPDEARYTDSTASAELGGSLRVIVTGADGEHLETDMPGGVGGQGERLSPGWLFRAAIASCVASTIGMEAARVDVQLESLVVDVDSESDDRGILGMDENVPPGPLSLSVRVTVSADDMDQARLRDLVETGARRCPVFDAVGRAVDVSLEVHPG